MLDGPENQRSGLPERIFFIPPTWPCRQFIAHPSSHQDADI